jgi:hypothetical protein
MSLSQKKALVAILLGKQVSMPAAPATARPAATKAASNAVCGTIGQNMCVAPVMATKAATNAGVAFMKNLRKRIETNECPEMKEAWDATLLSKIGARPNAGWIQQFMRIQEGRFLKEYAEKERAASG